MDTRTARPFSFSFNTSDYRILHVDPDQGRLYLGSREYLVSLDMQNINKEPLIIHWPAPAQRKGECQMTGKGRHGECANFVRLIEPWNRTHLYTCGTGAYKPICTFINRGWRAEDYLFRLVPGYVDSGKGKCSYDPNQENVAALINGNLYAGVPVDFMSTDPGIFRTMGSRPAVRSEQYDSKWLNEPVFVHMKQIPDSAEKNDDKLYFFFREKSLDSGAGASPSVLARVGRVCLNDEGGQKSLVNKWTTFLKARLVCSVMGDDGVETFFDELRDVFIQPTQDERNPVVYAVFSTSGYIFPSDRHIMSNYSNFLLFIFFFSEMIKHVHFESVKLVTPAPVKTMYISAKRQQLYASSEEGLTQMSLHRCGVYGKACSDCCLARDPYCAWDGENCSAFTQATKRRSRRQDVKHGDPLRQCRGYIAKVERRLQEKVQFGVEGSSTFLECVPRSPQATIKWLYQREGRRKLLNREGEVLKTPQGVLLKTLTKADAGLYHCLATENNFKHTLARVSLRILDRDIAVALTTPDEEEEASRSHHKNHHQDPAAPTPALLLEPEMRLFQQYCQSYWEQLTAGGNSQADLPKRANRRHTEALKASGE
uniref:Sema domain, immunoglobulin domain (Ig), short basic domain, secreted, (semaphorin) 3Ga n=1 Tax=Cyprinus carpio carpio TaxID=630221 RepID=A0A9J7WXA1_CYPCA